MELRDELEEEGLDEDAIDAKCDALRTKLLEKAASDAAKGWRYMEKDGETSRRTPPPRR